jgi:peptidoglycan/LPS O-acetylase OafA/YrhL
MVAPSPTAPGSIPALTGLRFVAALWVVLCHYGLALAYPPGLREISAQGRAAVSLFFVLSGFVLAYNYADWFHSDYARFGRFAWARFTRIYPMCLFALLAMTPIALRALDDPRLSLQFSADQLALAWLANLTLLHGFIPLASMHLVWHLPSWSISTEAFFYLAFPFFARHVLGRLRSGRALLNALLILYLGQVIAALGATAILRALPPDPILPSVWYYSPLLRVWEFLQGCVIGAALPRFSAATLGRGWLGFGSARARNGAAALVLAGLLGVAAFVAQRPAVDLLSHGGLHLLYSPLFALLIAVLASGASFLTPLLACAWMQRLGESSYSLYITHWIPLSLLLIAVQPGVAPAPWLALLVMGATVWASLGLHRFVERPMRLALLRDRRPASTRRRWRPSSAGVDITHRAGPHEEDAA